MSNAMSGADEKNMESIETILFSLSFIHFMKLFFKKKKKILELDLD